MYEVLVNWFSETGEIAVFFALLSVGFRALGRAFKGKFFFM